MKDKPTVITRLSEEIDKNAFGKLGKWFTSLFSKGKMFNHDDYPHEEDAEERWGVHVDIFLPIEKALYDEAKPLLNQHQPCRVNGIFLEVDTSQAPALERYLDIHFDKHDTHCYGGQKLCDMLRLRILNTLSSYQHADIDIADDLQLHVSEINSDIAHLLTVHTPIQVKALVTLLYTAPPQAAPQPSPAAATTPTTTGEYSILIEIHDSEGRRETTISHFPVRLGRECSEPDVYINGVFVSREHLQLDFLGDQLIATDNHSKHGVFVNGKRIQANENNHKIIKLMAKDVMRLAGQESQNYSDYPQITFLRINTSVAHQPGSNPTPLVQVPVTPTLKTETGANTPEPPTTPLPSLFKIKLVSIEGEKPFPSNSSPV